MNAAALIWLTAAFFWTALRTAGVEAPDWNIAVLAPVLLAAVILSRPRAPRLERWLTWPLVLLPASGSPPNGAANQWRPTNPNSSSLGWNSRDASRQRGGRGSFAKPRVAGPSLAGA